MRFTWTDAYDSANARAKRWMQRYDEKCKELTDALARIEELENA